MATTILTSARTTSQTARAGSSLGLRHAWGRTERKWIESPASTSWHSPSTSNSIRPSSTITSSSPGWFIGTGPLSASGSTTASAPAIAKPP